MWKYVTRGIRETLERRACRTNVYSQTSQDSNAKSEVKNSLTCNHKFLAPSFSVFNKEFCGSRKTDGAEDKEQDSKWNTKYTWSEAVGWVNCVFKFIFLYLQSLHLLLLFNIYNLIRSLKIQLIHLLVLNV